MDDNCSGKLLQLINALNKNQSINYFKKINNYTECGIRHLQEDINGKIDNKILDLSKSKDWVPLSTEIDSISKAVSSSKSYHMSVINELYNNKKIPNNDIFNIRSHFRYCCY